MAKRKVIISLMTGTGNRRLKKLGGNGNDS
jgi:hypothetical protein